MASKRPLNPKDKILRRFYEPLVLLSVLDRTRGAIKSDSISDRGLNEQTKLWRDFLDHSSFLCDSEKGGDTVTAIATQRTYERSVFWLASNSFSRHKARDHLEWILSRLERLNDESTVAESVETEIFDRCVSFSFKRIKTYVSWLEVAINRARLQKKDFMTVEDEQLFETLREFEACTHDHHALCKLANACRSSEIIHVLSQRHNAQDHRNVWSDIRHLIGRLGLWTKAVRLVIRGARRFPHYIENAQVQVVELEDKPDVPCVDHLTGLEGVVRRILPVNDEAIARELTTALTDLNEVAEIGDSFREAYMNMTPRPHAELLVLEKFHHDKLEFVHDDKYIGCSKPSCYCCYLYIQSHPGQFSPRPSHGNLWINWAPPIPLPNTPTRGAGNGTFSRLQDHHTFKMLQQMLVSIRTDLKEQILSKRPKRARLPDSTTGVSSVLALANQALLQDLSVARTDVPSPLSFHSDDLITAAEHEQIQSVDEEERFESSDEEGDVLVFRGRKLHAG